MDQKSGNPNQRRRAVLQGSLAAPVVLTVSSPAAATMTSLGRCLRNAAHEQPSFIAASQDTWLRKQIEVVKLEKVKVKDKATEKDAAKGAKAEVTDWVFFDQSLNDFVTVAAPHSRLNLGAVTTDWKVAERSSRWALVWVDERTKSISMTTQIQPPSGCTPVPTSCWTSITGG